MVQPAQWIIRPCSFPTTVDADACGVSVRRLWDVWDVDACCLSVSAPRVSAPRNLPNPLRQAVPSRSRSVSDPLPVSFTNFIALCALHEHAILYIMVVFCTESYILAKSTKLSQLELLFWLKYAPNSLSVGASPQTPLGSLERSPDTTVAFRGLLLRVGK